MSLADAYGELCLRIRGAIEALKRADAEFTPDQPLHGVAEDMVRALDAALAAAERGRGAAAAEPVNLDRATAMLPRSQHAFNLALGQYRASLGSPQSIEGLIAGGRAQAAWAVHCCQQPLSDIGWALTVCWRELVSCTRRLRCGE